MKTITYLSFALCAVLAVGCATVPKELVDARQAYDQASRGPAAKLAPEALSRAQEALTQAEASYADRPTSYHTKDLAYSAQRKAQMAEVQAGIVAARKQGKQASKEFQAAQAQIISKTKSDLDKSREENNRLLMALGKFGTVREESRGIVMTLSGSVLFAFNQSTLLPSAQTTLKQVAETILGSEGRRLLVEGHTDSIGSASYNYRLSQRRADAVRSFLISSGYPSELIEARGIGKDRPVASNANAEGRANNRRVEIIILREPGK